MRLPLLFSLLALTAALPAFAAEEVQYYQVRQDDAAAGSNLKRPLVQGKLPLDKSYAQLTPQQQAQLKSFYESMAAGDEPPFPVSGLNASYQALAKLQSNMRVEGELLVYVNVDSRGKATAVSVAKTPAMEMAKLAATLLMLETYKPAVCQGKPCAMEFPFQIEFVRPVQEAGRVKHNEQGR